MDLGQKEAYLARRTVAEIAQPASHLRVVEVGVLFFGFAAKADARFFVYLVVLAQAVVIQDIVHGFAAFATKALFVVQHRYRRARLPAVETSRFVARPGRGGGDP